MSKTINRTILNTSAVVSVVNMDEQTFEDRNVSVVGNFDEESLLKYLNKRRSPDEMYCKVKDIDHETVMYTMSDIDFIRFGHEGLKPTTRTRYVTTHIKSVIAKVLVVNKNDEVERLEFDVTGMSKAKIRKIVEETGNVFVKVLDTTVTEMSYYMPEEDFIAYATVNG